MQKHPRYIDGTTTFRSTEPKQFHPRKVAPIVIPPIVASWLRDNFVVEQGAVIPKARMYDEYEEFCKRASIRPKSPNVFGKMVKQFFPSLGCSRIGSQHQQRAYYTGIALNIHNNKQNTVPNPQHHNQLTTVSTTRTTTTTLLIRPAPIYQTNKLTTNVQQQQSRRDVPTFPPILEPNNNSAQAEEDRMIRTITKRFFSFTPNINLLYNTTQIPIPSSSATACPSSPPPTTTQLSLPLFVAH